MEPQYIDLDEQAFLLINGPLVLLNLTANIFYACCLVLPSCNRCKLKQPLKTLLGFLVLCSITHFICVSLMLDEVKGSESIEVYAVLGMIALCSLHSSMTCSVWLNFYYYIQIVPSRRELFTWVKRNIRSFIYIALLLEEIFMLFTGAISSAHLILETYRNFTDINTQPEYWNEKLHLTNLVSFCIVQLHILACLCIMTASSFSTVHYLQRHMRNVAQGGFSTPRIQSQMRVTITGISQGVVYFLSSAVYFFESFSFIFSTNLVFSYWVSLTIRSLIVSGTTVNLGVGQTIFRQRATGVWKALKALSGVGMASNDVKVHTAR